MDTALNVASAVLGLLGLTIQIVQVTHRHKSGVSCLSHLVTSYLAELVALKRLLSEVQDAMLLQPHGPVIAVSGPSPLAETHLWIAQTVSGDLNEAQSELRELHERLSRDERCATTPSGLRNLVWPLTDEETIKWANRLSHFRHRLHAAFLMGGLSVPQSIALSADGEDANHGGETQAIASHDVGRSSRASIHQRSGIKGYSF